MFGRLHEKQTPPFVVAIHVVQLFGKIQLKLALYINVASVDSKTCKPWLPLGQDAEDIFVTKEGLVFLSPAFLLDLQTSNLK